MTDTTNNAQTNATGTIDSLKETLKTGLWKTDKFLHFFDLPTEKHAKTFVGLELVWGVRIICIVSLLLDLLSVVGAGEGFTILFESVQLFSVGVNLYATWSLDFHHAFLGYYIQMVVFYIQLLMTVVGLYAVFTLYASLEAAAVFLALVLVMLAFKVYLLWICYSYAHALQNKEEKKESVAQN